MSKKAVASLEELDRAVLEAYLKAADGSSRFERSSSAATLSVQDLELHTHALISNGGLRPSTLLLEVLQEWRNLVRVLLEDADDQPFLEYMKNLWTAFRDCFEIDATHYRHLKTLVSLLANTAINRRRDSSTECRFVTILEVLLSYGRNWSPSEEVSRFWVRLMQRVSASVPPVNFRRKAYRVLVSLSWVPSSTGLLEACSFEGTRQSLDPEKAPPRVRRLLDKIRSRPRPRYDCVNQLLDRLKDETDVCVAITSERQGMGKTTLASLVASHPSILRVFQVLWLPMTDEPLSFDLYIRHLNDLCEQLSISIEWPACAKRFEEPALRKMREEAAMFVARDRVAQALQRRDDNYLLVLDDLNDGRKLEWFRFNERQSVIVTTGCKGLQGVDWTVDLAPMSEEEAIELFLAEANFPITHVLGVTTEVRTVVQRCEYHPLIVRTVARWYQMKQVSAGIVGGLEELLRDMHAVTHQQQQPSSAQKVHENGLSSSSEHGQEHEIMSLLSDCLEVMLAPVRLDGGSHPDKSGIFILCLASMAVVFPDQAPLDSILLLWDQVLKTEPTAIDELSQKGDPTPQDIRKQAWMVAEGLSHMGVISLSERSGHAWVEVHHWLYKNYALKSAREKGYSESYERTSELWNRAFVTAYFTQRIEGRNNRGDDNSWEYAIASLPSHIFKAKMFPMGETILAEEHFFRARVDALGWDRAIDSHIEDCIKLQRTIEASDSTFPGMSRLFEKTAEIISSKTEGSLGSSGESFIIDVSSALFKIGLALAECGYYDGAMIQLENAQKLLPQSQELRASILYGLAWVLLASNHTELALKKIRASRKLMDDNYNMHDLYKEALQLQGEALVGECEYKEAAEFFEAAVVLLNDEPDKNRIELGTMLHKKGRLHHMMGEVDAAKDALQNCVNWKNGIGEVSLDLALVHSALADIALETRKVAEAREHFESALQVLHSLKCDRENVDLRLLTGKLQSLRNEFAGSLESLNRARVLINNAPNLFMEKAPYDLRCIARLYKKRGHVENALATLQESLVLTNDRPFSLERSAGLHDLAQCLIDQDEVNEGLCALEQSLEIRIVKLGECVQVLDTLSAIGSVHMSLGALEEALAVFEKVNELTNRIAPNDVERFASVLYSIGEVLDAKRDYSAASAKFKECMDVLKRDHSEDHPHIAKALQRLGDVSAAKKDLEKAFEYYCEALRIRQLHKEERGLAETLHSIGVLTRKKGSLEAAREPLLNALEVRKKLDNDRETGQTLLELGNIFRLQADAESAMSLYEKCLEVLHEKDDIRGCVYLAMGHLRLSAREDQGALHCYERARDIRMALYGKDNLKTGNASRSLGLVKYLQRNGDEALVHLNEFIRVVELNDDDNNEEEGDDIDYVLAVLLMSDIHRSNGRDEQSRNLIGIAKEVCDESKQVAKELPALADMVNRRQAAPEEAPATKASGGGFLKRLKAEDSGSGLTMNAEEENVLRNIVFIDD
jgi:tetratricopeptide (TPR) repeat protein